MKADPYCYECDKEMLLAHWGEANDNMVVEESNEFDTSFYQDQIIIDRLKKYSDALSASTKETEAAKAKDKLVALQE